MTQLVLTVGGSPAPLVTAIRTLRPEFVVFLCSEDANGAKGSYQEVPEVVAATDLEPTDFEIVRIAKFDDLEVCYLESRRVLEGLRARMPHARIVADYTGGTKSMSAGLAMAAVDDGACDLSLVTGTRADRERVSPGTEYARAVAVSTARARKQFEEAAARLERYDYTGALAVLERVATTPVGGAVASELPSAIALCRALDAWDRFQHAEARRLMAPHRRELLREWRTLEELCRDRPRDPYLVVQDLLLNAERRAAQGRYDDAVARVYRALELIAQIRLRELWDVDPSDVELERLPETSRETARRWLNREGKIQLGLIAAWEVLHADELLGPWYREQQGRIRNWVQLRNQSILAHGLSPIDGAKYAGEGSEGMRLCREALAQLGQRDRGRASVQLPTRLPPIERAMAVGA